MKRILNFLLILFVVLSSLRGFSVGLIRQLSSLLRTIISVVIAYQFSSDMAIVLKKYFHLQDDTIPVDIMYKGFAFLILLICSRYALSFVFRFIDGIFSLPVLSTINRLGGLVFGVIQSIVVFTIIVFLLSVFPWEPGREAVHDSSYAQMILKNLPNDTLSE